MTGAPPRSLAIFGDMPHHRDAEGRLHGLEPVVAQLDHWGALFDRMVLCAPLIKLAPQSFTRFAKPVVKVLNGTGMGTRYVALREDNVFAAALASGSIPLVAST